MSETARETPTPPSSAKELFLHGHDVPVGYVCPTCGQVFMLTHTDLADPRLQKEVSERARLHCYRFCECGEPAPTNRLRCKSCEERRDAEKTAERFTRAEKVSIDDYPDQPIFSNAREGYFDTIDDFLDDCEDSDIETPTFVWAALPIDFHLDADGIIDDALERQEHYDGARDRISAEARKILQAYLNVWAEELKIRSWHIDYRRAVLLAPDNDSTSARNAG